MWSQFTAIKLASKLYQATMFSKLSSGTLVFLIGTDMLKMSNISNLLDLSNNVIETITKNCPLARTVVQAGV